MSPETVLSREALAGLRRRYGTDTLAARAAGLTRQKFTLLCVRVGLEKPRRVVTDTMIVRAWRHNDLIQTAAASVGLGRVHFSRRMKKLGLKRKPSPRRVSDDMILDAYGSTISFVDGAALVGMTPVGFGDRCKRIGLAPKRGGGVPMTTRRVPDQILDARLRVHRLGKHITIVEAARRAGMSYNGYADFLEAYDLPNFHKRRARRPARAAAQPAGEGRATA